MDRISLQSTDTSDSDSSCGLVVTTGDVLIYVRIRSARLCPSHKQQKCKIT